MKEFKVEGEKYHFIETSCYKLNTPKLLQYWQPLNGRGYLKVVPEPLSVPQGWGRWMTWDLQQTTKESKARLCSGWMESSCKNRVGMLWMNLWEAQLQNISIHAELFVLMQSCLGSQDMQVFLYSGISLYPLLPLVDQYRYKCPWLVLFLDQ